MQSFHGFYDKWCALLGYYNTNEQAYEATERIYKEHFGTTKYKNFETFKTMVSRHFKKPEPIVLPKVEPKKIMLLNEGTEPKKIVKRKPRKKKVIKK